MYQVDFRFLCTDRIVILLILVLLIRALCFASILEYDSLRIQYFYKTFVNNLHKISYLYHKF